MSCPGPSPYPPTVPTVLFGDPADFAIEAGTEPHLTPPTAVWGRMCLWCQGVAVGDISNPCCALYPAYVGFRHLPGDVDRLWADELTGLDDAATWSHFDGLLYGYHGDIEVPDDRTVEECQIDWFRWGQFDFLTNWGEQFDGFKSFLLCPPPGDTIRILYRGPDGPAGRGLSVSRAGFVAAADGFVRWFEAEQRRLQVV